MMSHTKECSMWCYWHVLNHNCVPLHGAHVECELTSQTVAHLVTKRTAGHSATFHPKRKCLAYSSPSCVMIFFICIIILRKLKPVLSYIISFQVQVAYPLRSKSFVLLRKALGWGSGQTLAKYAIHDIHIRAQLLEEISQIWNQSSVLQVCATPERKG